MARQASLTVASPYKHKAMTHALGDVAGSTEAETRERPGVLPTAAGDERLQAEEQTRVRRTDRRAFVEDRDSGPAIVRLRSEPIPGSR